MSYNVPDTVARRLGPCLRRGLIRPPHDPVKRFIGKYRRFYFPSCSAFCYSLPRKIPADKMAIQMDIETDTPGATFKGRLQVKCIKFVIF